MTLEPDRAGGVAAGGDPGAGRRSRHLGEYARTTVLVAATSAACLSLRSSLTTTDVAMLYLLTVVAVAARYRPGAALLAALLGVAAFDFGFVPPYYTFNVHDSAFVLTFAVMLAVALTMSHLTARVRTQAEEAGEREAHIAALDALSRELADAGDRDAILAAAVRHLERATGGTAAILPAVPDREDTTGPLDVPAAAFAVPLRSGTKVLGMAAVRPGQGRMLRDVQRRTVEAMAERTAIALEKAVLAEQHERARLEVGAERLRTALLSSLSHDLRTPLGSIEGAASSLLADAGTLPADVTQDLVETILEESQRMTRLVTNLLDMVRVETGALTVAKEWQPLEEALGVALIRLDGRLSQHPVEARLPPDLPLVPIDEVLVEQVFVNLLENAAKHTPPGTPVTVGAEAREGEVEVVVADRGPGIPAGEEEAVFRKFYRARVSEPGRHASGAGLGLTICRGIIAAHGGRMWAEPRPGGGATFRFTLPLDGPPPSAVPAEPDAA